MKERIFARERTYTGIKAEVLEGVYRPGEHILPAVLSMQFSASITPVKDALLRLVGEGFVEIHPNDGFHMPMRSETDLRYLYNCLADLLLLALWKLDAGRSPPPPAYNRPDVDDLVLATEHLFVAIIESVGNPEFRRIVDGLNERLRAVRRRKGPLIPDWAAELDILADLWQRARYAELRRVLGRYHQRRTDLVPALVRELHNTSDDQDQ